MLMARQHDHLVGGGLARYYHEMTTMVEFNVGFRFDFAALASVGWTFLVKVRSRAPLAALDAWKYGNRVGSSRV